MGTPYTDPNLMKHMNSRSINHELSYFVSYKVLFLKVTK